MAAVRSRGAQGGRNKEDVINIEIARILDRESGWSAAAERSRVVRGKTSRRPDIVVDTGRKAVIVETEFRPANGLNDDVNKAAQYDLRKHGLPIATLGVVLPDDTSHCNQSDIESHLMECDSLEYYIVSQDGRRFPPEGRLTGSLLDVRTAIRLASVPEAQIAEGYKAMAGGVERIQHIIQTRTRNNVKNAISDHLHRKPDDSTWRMAALVLLNAAAFYDELSEHRNDVKPTQALSVVGTIDHAILLDAWRGVRAIDYAPIFDAAIGILAAIPSPVAGDVIDEIVKTSASVLSTGANKFIDFYGMLYQQLLYDRKFVAAYYTRPEAATLLADLTMSGCDDDTWRDPDKIRKIRIADFACGSGSLLHAAYAHMINCSPLDLECIHPELMSECFWAADIFPIATHFAVSSLSSMFPSTTFDDCRIYTRRLGVDDSGGYHLGSLDLIDELEQLVDVGTMQAGRGRRQVKGATLQNNSCDYIVMNPPYVRATNHGGGREDPVPPFAIHGIDAKTQIAMGKHNSKKFSKTCAHEGLFVIG